jgi:hypothetical protein
VGEEDLADELAPAANPRLVEDALEVLLDDVRGDAQLVGDLRRGVPAQDEAGDVLFALA